jgi:phage-related baseplate assembly protein
MAAMPAAIDLSRLPAPEAVETLDFEEIFAAMRADAIARDPDLSDIGQDDPATKILQATAYRETLVRVRGNESVKDTMLAFAKGANLRHIGALFGVEALVLDPGDPEQGIEPTYELDDDLRQRIADAPEGFSVAGPEGAYRRFAKAAHPDVLDVDISSPAPAEVLIRVLSRTGDGTPSEALLAAVDAAVSPKDVRPIGDRVTVAAGIAVDYAIDAALHVLPGPDRSIVLDAAQTRLAAYIAARRRFDPLLGKVTVSGIIAALQVDGVDDVQLASPIANVVPADGQWARCTAVSVVLADDEG